MKWKTVLVTAVIVLLVAVLVLNAILNIGEWAFEPKASKDIKNRIKQYELVLEEQQLITEILTLKYEAVVIQAKFQPTPPSTRTVIESEKE